MIETMIGVYMFAWFGVFWLLIPRRSPFRFWAFIPAFICSMAVPSIMFESSWIPTSLPVVVGVVVIGGALPFAFLAWLLMRRLKVRKDSPIGIGRPLAATPSGTTGRTDRAIGI